MPREREGVHHQSGTEPVGRLTQVIFAVCAIQVERVLERAVDALRVTTPRPHRVGGLDGRGGLVVRVLDVGYSPNNEGGRMIQKSVQRDRSQHLDIEPIGVRGAVNVDVSPRVAAPSLPAYVIRGGQVFRSEWHPDGPSRLPVFEIRGDQIFESEWT